MYGESGLRTDVCYAVLLKGLRSPYFAISSGRAARSSSSAIGIYSSTARCASITDFPPQSHGAFDVRIVRTSFLASPWIRVC